MELPSIVIVGKNLLKIMVENVVRISNSKDVVIITSPSPYKALGRKLIDSLSDEGMDVKEHMVESATISEVDSLCNEKATSRSSCLVAVGGGKVIDVAKLSAYRLGCKFVSIPTVASHDGIASPMASIRGIGTYHSLQAKMPYAIIADMEVIGSSPFRYTASGCGDLVAKYTAVKDWRLAHNITGEYYGEYASQLATMSASIVMRKASDIRAKKDDGLRTVVEALISAGVAMGIAGSSRPCSGSEHLISHAIESLVENPPLHGERCGVATVFAAYLHKSSWKRVKRALESIGAPSTIPDLGIDRGDFIDAVIKAPSIRPDRYTILNQLHLNRAEVSRIIDEVGI